MESSYVEAANAWSVPAFTSFGLSGSNLNSFGSAKYGLDWFTVLSNPPLPFTDSREDIWGFSDKDRLREKSETYLS